MKAQLNCQSTRGFALVITLSLMLLLSILAIGLLTLSSISLRSATQGEAMSIARANARVALMLALGELQRSAGIDKCVTARADIVKADVANPQLTGVWDSWEIKATKPPGSGEYDKATKDGKFRSWLVSSMDPQAAREASFADTVISSPVTLWGKGTLGESSSTKGAVNATKVPLVSSAGALAWAVLDEGIKVRINTPFVNGATANGSKTAQLGTGERPGVEFITGLSDLERGMFEKGSAAFARFENGITRLNFSLAAQNIADSTRAALQLVTHDVTTHSVGLFTDVAHGGLKQDFHLLTNAATLPAAYANKGVYVSRLGMTTASAPSDPSWASLHQFSRLYRETIKDAYPANITNTSGIPLLKGQTPTGWVAGTTTADTPPVTTINTTPPPGVLLMPTIAKVQMLFSLIGHDIYGYPPPIGSPIPPDAPVIHSPQGGQFKGTKFEYDLHLLYTPIVTFHNPYNVAIECSDLRVQFVHVPFAMQVFRNGVAQSLGLVPMETMYADNDAGQRGKIFGMNIKNKTSSGLPDTSTFRLLPGEVKVFSPYIDPERTYAMDLQQRKYWDIYVGTHITDNIDAIPGWRGYGIGYSCDWLAGNQPVDGNGQNGHWASCYGLARDDQIHVEFAPLAIPLSNNKFTVQMSAPDPSNSGTRIIVNAIEIDYEKPEGLQEFIFGKGVSTMRYPKTGAVMGIDLVDHSTTPLKETIHPKPFALLSLQAKSTSGGRDASNKDGRLATKPWCFAHANVGASTQKVITDHSANFSHEIDLQLLDVAKGATELVPVDAQDRGLFMSGHSSLYGTKFGGQYDIPLTPIQSFPTLNGANPGGATVYLPRVAQPIGNSWAHPLITLSKLSETKSAGNYLDHSFLLNLALYDTYYFSGLAAQTGPFASGKTTATLAAEFIADKGLDDPRLILHRPNGKLTSVLASDVVKSDAYTRVAAWQLMNGAFNVNSTSVLAWKAMLASIHDSQSIYNQLIKSGATSTTTPSSKLSTLTATGKKEARISRFRLPASLSAADAGESKDAYWLGPREYSDTQLQTLAENIVKQVRLRGPFLSMAEFVNRRLGSGDTAQRGALQQAIDDSNLNQTVAKAAGEGAGFEIPAAAVKDYKYANIPAGYGSSYQGAPGYLTQADVLSVLGNAATPRSDTFTIRGYGEARDASGKVLASATCEAVVQRVPEWVDPADAVETSLAALVSKANKTYGRRFLITSICWLNSSAI